MILAKVDMLRLEIESTPIPVSDYSPPVSASPSPNRTLLSASIMTPDLSIHNFVFKRSKKLFSTSIVWPSTSSVKNINPYNVMLTTNDTAVVIDFNSCHMEG